eukprot:Colp12_sorted_trinity150504_noHs@3828
MENSPKCKSSPAHIGFGCELNLLDDGVFSCSSAPLSPASSHMSGSSMTSPAHSSATFESTLFDEFVGFPSLGTPFSSTHESVGDLALSTDQEIGLLPALCFEEEKTCSNCGTTKTPLWRRGPDNNIVCNACGLYVRTYGHHRKLVVSSSESETDGDESGTHCTNCGTSKTSLWRRDGEGKIVCNACGLFWKTHGTHRPKELRTSTHGLIVKRKRKANSKEKKEMKPFLHALECARKEETKSVSCEVKTNVVSSPPPLSPPLLGAPTLIPMAYSALPSPVGFGSSLFMQQPLPVQQEALVNDLTLQIMTLQNELSIMHTQMLLNQTVSCPLVLTPF